MFIHSEDNAEVKMKITDGGGLFIYCPGCKRVWETGLNIIREPRLIRPITYDGTGINLDLGSSESVKTRTKPPAELAADLFPEAF